MTLAGGKYANAADADAFLVEGRPAYLGAYVEFMCRENARWERLPEAVKTGEPSEQVQLGFGPAWDPRTRGEPRLPGRPLVVIGRRMEAKRKFRGRWNAQRARQLVPRLNRQLRDRRALAFVAIRKRHEDAGRGGPRSRGQCRHVGAWKVLRQDPWRADAARRKVDRSDDAEAHTVP